MKAYNIRIMLCFAFLLCNLNSLFGQAEDRFKLEKFILPSTPVGFYHPSIIAGSESDPIEPVLSLVFDIYYDTLLAHRSHQYFNSWFNPDGHLDVIKWNYPAEKRMRVILQRTDGIPKSGFGQIFRDGGLGIIDMVEIRDDPFAPVAKTAAKASTLVPNIADQRCTLVLSQSTELLRLFDSGGNLIWKKEHLPAGSHPISTASLKSGVFYLEMLQGGNSEVLKLLVLHQ